MNKIFLYFMIIFCYSCMSINDKNIKEIYVVYDTSYTQFAGNYDPTIEDRAIKKGCELVIEYFPDPNRLSIKVYRSPSNRQYSFIGKFLIDKEKNISFVPVTSSKGFQKKKYQKEEIEDIKSSCFIANSRTESLKEGRIAAFYDIEKKKFMPLIKDNPNYADYAIFGFADYIPQYLVIKNEYGKKLMENGIILPDPNELKDNIVWQDWYNYWGLTDYKIEIP